MDGLKDKCPRIGLYPWGCSGKIPLSFFKRERERAGEGQREKDASTCQRWTAGSIFHTGEVLGYSCLGAKKPPGWTHRAQQGEAKDTVKFPGSRHQGEIGMCPKESREPQKDPPGGGSFLSNK